MAEVQVNTFNDFSVAATESYPLISSMSFMLKPQVGATLFDINPLESDTGEMMKMGLMKEVMGEQIVHHEANKRFDAPFVNTDTVTANVYGVASVGNGDPALYSGLDYIQLALASHSPSSGTTGAPTNSLSKPRAGQLIQFKNRSVWRIQGKRTSVAGAHRLYLQKVVSTDPSLALTITNASGTFGGDQFAVFTTAFEEATYGMQDGQVPTSKTYTNTLQNFNELYKVTDFQERNETYPLNWQGKVINFVYEKGISDTEVSFAFQEDNGLFFTPKDDGALTGFDPSGNSVSVTTTQGYLPNLELNAQKLFYDNNPTIALFEQMIRLRRKLHQGRECLLQCGFEFILRAKDIVTQFGVNGGMVYNRQALDLNINQIKIGDFTFNIKELRILNHPEISSIPGFPYPYYFIIAPMDKTKDPKTGIMRDAFCILYKKQVGGGARGHYKIWETGGNAAVPTNTQQNRVISISSRKGMQVVGATRFILGKKA